MVATLVTASNLVCTVSNAPCSHVHCGCLRTRLEFYDRLPSREFRKPKADNAGGLPGPVGGAKHPLTDFRINRRA